MRGTTACQKASLYRKPDYGWLNILLFTGIFAALTGCSSNDSAPPVTPVASDCSYNSSGKLYPNTGIGVYDPTLWAPDMISPIAFDKAVARSQVYSPGGNASSDPDECAALNFNYPHWDTFCERRSADRDSYNCPTRAIHQGIDINAGDREDCLALKQAHRDIRNGADPTVADLIPIVAVMDGLISYIGSYTVDLSPADSEVVSKFRYLHLNMRTLRVEFGDSVRQGDIIGYYSNDFGGSATTFHLHMELIAFVDGQAQYVSPYASFISSIERAGNFTCRELG